MRVAEGEKIKEDLKARLNKIEDMSGFKRRTKKFGTLSLNDPRKVMNTLRIQNENLIDGDVVKNYLYTILNQNNIF